MSGLIFGMSSLLFLILVVLIGSCEAISIYE